jgi:LysM repeat protein
MPLQNRMLRAAAALAVIGFVAACEAPMPTAAPDVAASSPDAPEQAPVAERADRRIVVQAGQSLSRIAATYGVPQRAIIAANDLTPPYKIKIGQQLLIPSAEGPPPEAAAVGAPAPEAISAEGPALPEPAAPPPTAGPAPPPDVPAVKPFEVAAPAGAKSPEPLSAPVSSGSTELPAPAAAAAAPAPTPVPAAAPSGVTCPAGTIGMWSAPDIIKVPAYICHKPQSQS